MKIVFLMCCEQLFLYAYCLVSFSDNKNIHCKNNKTEFKKNWLLSLKISIAIWNTNKFFYNLTSELYEGKILALSSKTLQWKTLIYVRFHRKAVKTLNLYLRTWQNIIFYIFCVFCFLCIYKTRRTNKNVLIFALITVNQYVANQWTQGKSHYNVLLTLNCTL